MTISNDEARQIAESIRPIFDEVSSNYSFEKYPAVPYGRFKAAYAAFETNNHEIHDSLVWKWGHWGKAEFPQAHKNLITEVKGLWPFFLTSGKTRTAQDTFEWWLEKLGRQSRFITVAFITHLVHYRAPLPIIDQHNFRAMNALLSAIRPAKIRDRKPNSWNDISDLTEFMTSLLSYLPGKRYEELDRFLMMYGKKIKPSKRRAGRSNVRSQTGRG